MEIFQTAWNCIKNIYDNEVVKVNEEINRDAINFEQQKGLVILFEEYHLIELNIKILLENTVNNSFDIVLYSEIESNELVLFVNEKERMQNFFKEIEQFGYWHTYKKFASITWIKLDEDYLRNKIIIEQQEELKILLYELNIVNY